MAAKKKTALKKSTSKAMISMEEYERRMAEEAEKEAAKTGGSGGGSYVSIKGGSFTYQGADLGEEINVVIIDWTNEKAYYDTPYDPDEPSSPACWAIGDERPNDLEPSDLSPKKQSDTCGECWANEFGSADNGKGKACKDSRRMAMISADQLDDPVEDIEVVFLKTPPTSCKNFDKYVNGAKKLLKRPTYGVITRVFFDDEADYEVLKFEIIDKISSVEHMQKIEQLREQIAEDLRADYDPDNYKGDERKKKPARKKAAKKKVAKKKASKSKFSR